MEHFGRIYGSNKLYLIRPCSNLDSCDGSFSCYWIHITRNFTLPLVIRAYLNTSAIVEFWGEVVLAFIISIITLVGYKSRYGWSELAKSWTFSHIAHFISKFSNGWSSSEVELHPMVENFVLGVFGTWVCRNGVFYTVLKKFISLNTSMDTFSLGKNEGKEACPNTFLRSSSEHNSSSSSSLFFFPLKPKPSLPIKRQSPLWLKPFHLQPREIRKDRSLSSVDLFPCRHQVFGRVG